MRVEHINPFIVALTEAFKAKLGITPHKKNIGIKNGYTATHDITAVIGLSGNAFGSFALSFPKEASLRIVAKMMGEEGVPDEALAEGIGQLAAGIAESAKTALESGGIKTYLSIPKVILGRSHYICRLKDVPCVEIEFESEFGNFTLEVSLKVPQEAGTPG